MYQHEQDQEAPGSSRQPQSSSVKFHMPTQKINIVHKKAYVNNLKNITDLLKVIKSGISTFCSFDAFL